MPRGSCRSRACRGRRSVRLMRWVRSGWPCSRPVLACELGRRVDRVAAAEAQEDARVRARRSSTRRSHERPAPAVGDVAEGLVRLERRAAGARPPRRSPSGRARRGMPEAGRAVEVALAPVVPEVDALAACDHELVPGTAAMSANGCQYVARHRQLPIARLTADDPRSGRSGCQAASRGAQASGVAMGDARRPRRRGGRNARPGGDAECGERREDSDRRPHEERGAGAVDDRTLHLASEPARSNTSTETAMPKTPPSWRNVRVGAGGLADVLGQGRAERRRHDVGSTRAMPEPDRPQRAASSR